MQDFLNFINNNNNNKQKVVQLDKLTLLKKEIYQLEIKEIINFQTYFYDKINIYCTKNIHKFHLFAKISIIKNL